MIFYILILILLFVLITYFLSTKGEEEEVVEGLKDGLRYICISLPYRNKKFNFKKYPFVELFSATKGKSLRVDTIPNGMLTTSYKTHLLNTPNQMGHLGCTFSHVNAWKSVQEQTIILEDDVILDKDFSTLIHKKIDSVSNLDSNWDILLLGFSCSYDSYKKCHENDNGKIVDGIVPVKIWMGLWGYVINGKKSARKILDHIYPLRWHIDHHLANLIQSNKIKVYGCIPNIAYHPGRTKVDSWDYEHFESFNNYISDTNI